MRCMLGSAHRMICSSENTYVAGGDCRCHDGSGIGWREEEDGTKANVALWRWRKELQPALGFSGRKNYKETVKAKQPGSAMCSLPDVWL